MFQLFILLFFLLIYLRGASNKSPIKIGPILVKPSNNKFEPYSYIIASSFVHAIRVYNTREAAAAAIRVFFLRRSISHGIPLIFNLSQLHFAVYACKSLIT